MPQLPRSLRKKLRAATARRPIAFPKDMEFEEGGEPNMKLSRALLIVLVLHIVAVAGILAFNTIKTRERGSSSVATAPAPVASAPARVDSPAAKPAAGSAEEEGLVAVRQPTSKPASTPTLKGKEVRKAQPVSDVSTTGKTYTVVKGDNPVKIARKLGVSYDALLEVNKISDPRKLKPGQKLQIPQEKTARK